MSVDYRALEEKLLEVGKETQTYTFKEIKVCQFPVDGRIQNTIKSELGVNLLKQNGVQMYASSSWSKNDHWEDFLDYQARVRVATEQYHYYSPLIWEATHWH